MPCGVWAAPSRKRSTVPATRPSSTRLSVSITGTTGIAAPCSAAAPATRATAPGRRADARRRGPGRLRPGNPRRARRARGDRVLASRPPFDDGPDPGREPRGRDLADSPRRGHHDNAADDRSAERAASVQASTGRPSTGAASLSGPPIRVLDPAATTTRVAAAHSPRGWAKIMRPATVCSTRVTTTPNSRSMNGSRPRPRSSSRRPGSRPLARLLALLDDPDPQLLAGVHDRLHRVRQLVDVQDPDPLQLGHPVQVEVVGQDRRSARGRRRPAWRRPR